MDWKDRRTSLLALLSAAMIMLSGYGSTDAVQSNTDSTQSQISSSYKICAGKAHCVSCGMKSTHIIPYSLHTKFMSRSHFRISI